MISYSNMCNPNSLTRHPHRSAEAVLRLLLLLGPYKTERRLSGRGRSGESDSPRPSVNFANWDFLSDESAQEPP